MTVAATRRAARSRNSPSISCRRISPAGIEETGGATSTPHDHLADRGVGPDRGVTGTRSRRAGSACCNPTISGRIVFPTTVQIAKVEVVIDQSAPHDHLAAGPDGSVSESRSRRVRVASRSPDVSGRIVSSTVAKINVTDLVPSAPHNHLSATPNRRVTETRRRHIRAAGGGPRVIAGVILGATVHIGAAGITAPDDHEAASPDGAVIVATRRCTRRACCCPGVGCGIVPSAGIKVGRGIEVDAAPNDHLRACPDSCMTFSRRRRVCGAGSGPTVRAGIVSAAGIQVIAKAAAIIPAPDNHFSARPHRTRKGSPTGRSGRGCGSPCVVTISWDIRYFW
jgi:hypothetical protein